MKEFEKAIQNYITQEAAKDADFAERIKDKSKNINDCVTYILNEVKKMKASVLSNEEVFGMAIHYYQESDVTPGPAVKATVKMTDDVFEDSKQPAKVVEMKPKPAPKKKKQESIPQLTLF